MSPAGRRCCGRWSFKARDDSYTRAAHAIPVKMPTARVSNATHDNFARARPKSTTATSIAATSFQLSSADQPLPRSGLDTAAGSRSCHHRCHGVLTSASRLVPAFGRSCIAFAVSMHARRVQEPAAPPQACHSCAFQGRDCLVDDCSPRFNSSSAVYDATFPAHRCSSSSAVRDKFWTPLLCFRTSIWLPMQIHLASSTMGVDGTRNAASPNDTT